MICNQSESLQCLPHPPFHRVVSNEHQAMMTHCVPAMTMPYHSPLQVGTIGSTQLFNIHETSAQELYHHHPEYSHMLGNLKCQQTRISSHCPSHLQMIMFLVTTLQVSLKVQFNRLKLGNGNSDSRYEQEKIKYTLDNHYSLLNRLHFICLIVQ